MLQTFLSILAILLAGVCALFLLGRLRRSGIAGVAQAAALFLGIALETFDLLAFRHPDQLAMWRQWGLFVEAALPGFWLLFALTFARAGRLPGETAVARMFLFFSPVFFLAPLLAPVDSFYYSPDFAQERLLFLGRPGFVFSIALFAWLTVALFQLERTLAAQPRHARWQGKFELLGAGVLLAGYLLYYSQGLLHRTVDMNLLPVRSLALASGAALMLYSRWRRGEPARFQISREFAFRSIVLLAVGCYLIGLGLLGEGLRYLDPASRKTALAAAALLGGLAVVVLLLSETAKRRLRVWLHKNFFQEKYDYREQWRRFTRQLASVPTAAELHRTIPLFFTETFAVQGACLYLRHPEGENFILAATFGMAAGEESFPAVNRLVRRIAAGDWVYSSQDREPQIQAENGPWLERCEVSFVVPLAFDRALEGFVVLGRPLDRRESYSYEDFDLMKMLAAHAASALRNLRLADQLVRTRELAAVGRISAFVLHDLKNLTSRLSLVADNIADNLHDPEFRDDLRKTLASTVIRMKALVVRLQEFEGKTTLDLHPCDLGEVVTEGVRLAGGGVEVRGGSIPVRIDPEEIRKVVQNLVLNALEAGEGKPVRVEVGLRGRAFFRVRDEGCGMSGEFIRWHLFRPFVTTKEEGVGIGLYQCKHIVEAHGGAIDVQSVPGRGTTFTVWLPVAELPLEAAVAEMKTPVHG